jgi:phage-related protein (TIGR01555 family)
MPRNVKKASTALSRTNKPVVTAADSSSVARTGDGLENFVAGLGTDRDKRSYSYYNVPRTLTYFELENMFRTSWIAKRIVSVVASDMTREWRTVNLGDDDQNPRIKQIEDFEQKFGLVAKICEAIRLARLHGGSLIILGINDTDNLERPLVVESLGRDCLRWVRVMDKTRMAPDNVLVDDLTNIDFGLPEFYRIAESQVRVHHSRVIRFNGEPLPYFAWKMNGMWDDSVLQHVYDSVQSYDTVVGAITSMVYESNVDVINSPNLTETLSTKTGESKLTRRFQLAMMMKSFNKTLLLDENEKYEKKTNSFSGLDAIWERNAIDVCGAARIPMVVLFGMSAAGLNNTGENDIENYYSMISSEQETSLRPRLDYLDQITLRHLFGSIPSDFSYEFDSLWRTDDTEQATVDYQNAQRDQIYLNAGVISEGVVARNLKRRNVYQGMTNEDVELAEELAQQIDEVDEAQNDANRETARATAAGAGTGEGGAPPTTGGQGNA